MSGSNLSSNISFKVTLSKKVSAVVVVIAVVSTVVVEQRYADAKSARGIEIEMANMVKKNILYDDVYCMLGNY